MSNSEAFTAHPQVLSLRARFWDHLPDWAPRVAIAPLLGTITYTIALILYLLLTGNTLADLTGGWWRYAGIPLPILIALWAFALKELGDSGLGARIAGVSTSRTLRWLDLVVCLIVGVLWMLLPPFGNILSVIFFGHAAGFLLTASAPDRDAVHDGLRRRLRRQIDPDARPSDLTSEFQIFEVDWDMSDLGEPYAGTSTVVINLDRLQCLRALNPRAPYAIRGLKYSDAAVNEWIVRGTTEEVDRLASELTHFGLVNKFTEEQRAKMVLAMVQHIPYTTDLESKGVLEYWRYPIETLADGTGDCEDSTLLAAAILRRMGFPVAMIFSPGHVALGIGNLPASLGASVDDDHGVRYMYAETTESGWQFGQFPPDMTRSDITFVAIAPPDQPVLAAGD